MSPILAFKESGFEVSVYSPAGGKIPIDETSMNEPFRTEEVDKFLEDGGQSAAQLFLSGRAWEACDGPTLDCPGSTACSLTVQPFNVQQLSVSDSS